MKRPLRIALIGAGSMASKHARVIAESSFAELAQVIDVDVTRARALAGQWGGRAGDDPLAATRADAAVVASSSETHARIAGALLSAGVPLLVEKPLATDVEDLLSLHRTAVQTGTPLMCGFVERFNPAVQTLADIVDGDAGGDVVHVSSQRYSPPNARASTGVVDDLLIHDLDVVVRLARGRTVAALDARCWTPPGGRWPESSDVLLQFSDGTTANLSASRLHQRKIRSMTVAMSASTCEVDLLRRCVTVYRNVLEGQLVDGAASYQAQTVMEIPFVRSAGEPLALQLAHFVGLIGDSAAAERELEGLLLPHLIALEAAGRPVDALHRYAA